MFELIIASQNDGKIREIEQILNIPEVSFITYKDVSLWPDVEETGLTFYDNAMIKASALVNEYKKAAVSDDSGLEVDYLDGAPGVYSSRYGGEEGNSEKNIDKLLSELQGVSPDHRSARFRCIALLMLVDGQTLWAEGILEGNIAQSRKGKSGFGYDPVFIPDGEQRTIAEMTLEEKNKMSHRAKAFKKLHYELEVYLNQQHSI